MYENIRNIIVFPTALCNLNCSYCYITKSPELKLVDQELEESFKGDYYIDFMKEVLGDNIGNITRLDYWGAESALYLDRTFRLTEQLIDLAPNFNSIVFSTNATHEKLAINLKGLIDIFSRYLDREFTINIQISVDGPEVLNDRNRGKGVTKRIIENLKYMAQNKFFLGDTTNVKVCINTKSTLGNSDVALFLDKAYIIEYYKFFEYLYDAVNDIIKKDTRIATYAMINTPNIAEPYPFVKDDGVILAEVLKLLSRVEEENKTNKYFKYFKHIVWYGKQVQDNQDSFIYNQSWVNFGCFCGSGYSKIAFLPNKKFSGCVKVFSEYLESYSYENRDLLTFTKKENNSLLFKNKLEYDKHCDIMQSLYYDKNNEFNPNTTPNMVIPVSMIRYLAKIGQIDSKYTDEYEAKKAYRIILISSATCINDSLSIVGSYLVPYVGKLKLFLNGAVDYLYMNKGDQN